MKNIKAFFFYKIRSRILIFAFILGTLILATAIFYNSECDYRIRGVRASLILIRSLIKTYNDSKGKYPESIAELQKYEESEQKNYQLKIIITTFRWKGKYGIQEFNEINGNGGYYYNKTTGEVKVNLNKPVKHYLKFYFGKYRNEIPADW
jgi:hypothetical protein